MKIRVSFYWLSLMIVNIIAGKCVMDACTLMRLAVGEHYRALSIMTVVALALPWWPFAAALLGIICAIQSLVRPPRSAELHLSVLAGILLAEVLGFALTILGLLLPLRLESPGL